MKILIAGGTGILGKRLVPLLIESGYSVGVLSRSEQNTKKIENMGATAIEVSIFQRDKLIQAGAGYDIYIHLASKIPSKSRTSPKDWEINSRLRTEGVDNLLHAAKENDASHYIQQSFYGIYGHRDGQVVDEKTEIIDPVPTKYNFKGDGLKLLNNIVEMEKILIRYSDKVSITTMRFGWFYAFDAGTFQMMANRKFPKIGKLDNYWNMISVDDAVSAIIAVVEQPEVSKGEIFNINDDAVLGAEFLDTVAELAQGKSAGSVPSWLARFAVGTYAVNFSQSSIRMSNDKAEKVLGWKPKFDDYRDRIRHELEMLKSHQHR